MAKIWVIGGGIAGICMSHALRSRGVDVFFTDDQKQGGSSMAAAGIINPVTGKRFVKSWRFDEFLPFARSFYQNMETLLGGSIWQEKAITRLLRTPEEINDWSVRCTQPDYQALIGDVEEVGEWAALLHPGFKAAAILGAARVNFQNLITAYHHRAKEEGWYEKSSVNLGELPDAVKKYDAVVLCEGYVASENPWFPALPWQLAKGEALIVAIDGAKAASINSMLKKTHTLVPLGNGRFWTGGTYQWHYLDAKPSEGEKTTLVRQLNEVLAVPYRIEAHWAGVRPSVKDRRPFLGESPVVKRLFMFNGLGTKGALMAPYWAQHLTDHVLDGKTLDPLVDVQRVFSKNL